MASGAIRTARAEARRHEERQRHAGDCDAERHGEIMARQVGHQRLHGARRQARALHCDGDHQAAEHQPSGAGMKSGEDHIRRCDVEHHRDQEHDQRGNVDGDGAGRPQRHGKQHQSGGLPQQGIAGP